MKPNWRRCISCRKVSFKQDFWRIVRVFPSGKVQLDVGMGRSAYICPNSNCLSVAHKKNRLGRALRASVPETLYTTLWQRLSQSDNLQSTLSKSDTGEANFQDYCTIRAMSDTTID